MPASRFFQRKRPGGRSGRRDLTDASSHDMLVRKASLHDELERIDGIIERLRDRRRIGPDMSSDDLLDLFHEERERLFARLRDVDAALAEGDDPKQDAQVIEWRPRPPSPPDFS